MCGFCGFVGDPEGIDRPGMLAALQHRGPDDEGSVQRETSNGAVWLGHRRLAILDLSEAGHQPMEDEASGLLLAFNGEVYNYRALRADLRKRGYRFKGSGDTEVLLAAWLEWGAASVEKLRGMFAFAIWDPRQETLWLARDRLGEKPLYYTTRNRRLLFASELRSLLASGVLERRLDRAGLQSYLLFGCVTQPYSLLKDVRALGPGEILRFHAEQRDVTRYWCLADVAEHNGGAYPEAVARVRETLNNAVDLCTVSDVPIALLLSGGIDSTGILASLASRGHSEVTTFSVIFGGINAAFSEHAASDAAAARFGFRHTRVLVTGNNAARLLPRALAAVDQPSHDGFNHYLVLQALGSAGYKVALTGQGADELFVGYGRHHAFHIARTLARLRAPRGLTRRVHDWLLSGHPRRTRLRKALALLLPSPANWLAYAVRHMIFSPFDVAALMGTPGQALESFFEDSGGHSALSRLYRLETTHFLRNQLLRDGDQMSMACSVELRAPFVDYRLVEVLSELPVSLKIRNQRQKPLLVDAIDDALVRQAATRPKVGFAFPLRRWLAEELAELPIDAERLGLRPSAVRAIQRTVRAGNDHRCEWALVVLSDWACRNGIEAAL